MDISKDTAKFSRRNRLNFVILFMLTTVLLLSILGDVHSRVNDISFRATTGSKVETHSSCPDPGLPDIAWYPPAKTQINDLDSVINGSDIYGFIFNSSTTPPELPYDTYNWCDMPHVRAQEYQVPSDDYELAYVEVIHRHHKRTPYAANLFPQNEEPWDCSSSHLYYYGSPSPDNNATQVNWQISPPILTNLFPSTSTALTNSTCQFPQQTLGGLLDSRQHGTDLRSVYIDTLHFLPSSYNPSQIQFRVTNNVITSQVASQVIIGLYPSLTNTSIPMLVQPDTLDSLEPQYECPLAEDLRSSYGIGSENPTWLEHLQDPSTKTLLTDLDQISGVDTDDPNWHQWFDHYFDNLSSKLCHSHQLVPGCEECISTSQAYAVFRRGLYEYSYLYRDNPSSLNTSAGLFGIWMAELASNLRGAMNKPYDQQTNHSYSASTGTSTSGNLQQGRDTNSVIYRHNVAHDGSLSLLLSILQVNVMVWPGMGSEVIFELWKKTSTSTTTTKKAKSTVDSTRHVTRELEQAKDNYKDNGGCWMLRILWKGQPLRSSSAWLMGGDGDADADRDADVDIDVDLGMIPAQRFLAYIDGLVGVNGEKVPGLCGWEG